MQKTTRKVTCSFILTAVIMVCCVLAGHQTAYAATEYDRAVNASTLSENSKVTVTIPWEEYGFGAEYLKFTPSANGYYELYMYNSYGTPNAEDIYTEIYPSADDAYLQQNDATWIGHEYVVSDKADRKIVDLKKGKTYYFRIWCSASDRSYNTYQVMVKKHAHNWTRTSYEKGSFDNTGDGFWECKACYEWKSELYPMMDKIVLSKTSVTYTASAIKPSVTVKDVNGKTVAASNYTVTYSNNKNVGKSTVTITGKGNYKGKKSVTFKINPKGTTVSKVTKAKKAFTVKWKKQATQTSGYQIQYSTNKNFKSGNKTVTVKSNKTVSKKITKLKSKKTYYVRVRTFKTVSGIKYYSDWSKAKSVKTK